MLKSVTWIHFEYSPLVHSVYGDLFFLTILFKKLHIHKSYLNKYREYASHRSVLAISSSIKAFQTLAMAHVKICSMSKWFKSCGHSYTYCSQLLTHVLRVQVLPDLMCIITVGFLKSTFVNMCN